MSKPRNNRYLHVPQPVGFINTCSCCYANVALQILSMILPFWTVISSCPCELCNPEHGTESRHNTICKLLDVISQTKFGKQEQYNTSHISDYLGFSTDAQHQDVHQFLTSLLEEDVTEDKYSGIVKTSIGICPDMKEKLNSIFGQTLVNVWTCDNCGHVTQRRIHEEISQISINVSDLKNKYEKMTKTTFQELFMKAFKPELQNDPDNLFE